METLGRHQSDHAGDNVIDGSQSEIDFNDHVYNTRYMDSALEAIPPSIYTNNNICEFSYRLYETNQRR